MKRDLKPFVVEVKRGKRRPAGSRFELPDPDASFTEAARRAEVALFTAPAVEKIVEPVRRPESSGRVLPSLIEAPPAPEPADEPLPRRRGRKPGSKNKPKATNGAHPGSLAPSVEERPAVRNYAKPAQAAARPQPIARTPWVPVAARQIEAPRQQASGPAAAGSQDAAGTPSRPIRLRNRSSILARYVLGTTPGPGEQWKKRPRRGTA